MPGETLYLIDAYSQIYRAYFAPFGQLTSPTGEPTRATHVFFQMLLNMLRTRQPTYLAVAMDGPEDKLFRKQIYPDYKAQRDPPPEDLPVQADRIVQILHAAGVPILEVEGFEADDILATLARRHARKGRDVYLVSRDKDLHQLLDAHIHMYDPLRDEVLTPESLYASLGYWPKQAVDAQLLTGDSVDNVPGVEGIGPKTAAKLLAKYGSLEEILRHADELSPKQREKLLSHAPRFEQMRELLTLRDDVPVELDLEQARVEHIRWDAVRDIFAELGFRRLLEQLPRAAGEPPKAGPLPQRPPPRRRGRSLERPAQKQRAALVWPVDEKLREKLREPREGTYTLVDTPEAFEAVVRELRGVTTFAIDTETDSLNAIDANLVGVALSTGVGRGWYVPVRSVLGRSVELSLVREKLAPLLADERICKVGHNIKYDMLVLEQHGMPLRGPVFDTMIAAFVLHPAFGSYTMDKLVAGLFGHEMVPIHELIGRRGREQRSLDQIPPSDVAEYAGEDADYTWRMYELFRDALDGSDLERLFYDTEMPLVHVLARMEANGISIDADFLAQLRRRLDQRIEQIRDEVFALVGMQFNLDSPKQLAEVLFDKLGFRVVRRTKTSRSTDAATLETLAKETQHPALARILEYREIQKIRSTYVEALPAARSRRTGRIHTSYHQIGAITGRLSSSEPNLQNIPVRTELGRQIRRAFVPRDPQRERLIVADYSQIELRVLAHFSGDEALVRAFEEDRDIHAFVAAQVNNVPLEQVTPEMRSRAKAVNFGIIYGQTPHGLAQATGMSRTEAQRFIEQYFERYPRVRAFIDETIERARREGFVQTILGRRRPVPNIDSANRAVRSQAERIAVNTVLQGSAADLIKVAMIRLHERIEREKLPLRMLLQVHDELVCEGPASRARGLGEIIAGTMRTAMKLRVPLKVDVGIGPNWLEAK